MKNYEVCEIDGKIMLHCEEGSVFWALGQMIMGKRVTSSIIEECFFEMVDKSNYPIQPKYKIGESNSNTPMSVETFLYECRNRSFYIYKKHLFKFDEWVKNKNDKYFQIVGVHDTTYDIRKAGKSCIDSCGRMLAHNSFEPAPIKPDFSDANVGDECFSVEYGLGHIQMVFPKGSVLAVKYASKNGNNEDYKGDGRISITHSNPTLFHSAAQCVAYFAEMSFQLNIKGIV